MPAIGKHPKSVGRHRIYTFMILRDIKLPLYDDPFMISNCYERTMLLNGASVCSQSNTDKNLEIGRKFGWNLEHTKRNTLEPYRYNFWQLVTPVGR